MCVGRLSQLMNHGIAQVAALFHFFTSVNTSMFRLNSRLYERFTTSVTAVRPKVSDLCVCGGDASDYRAE